MTQYERRIKKIRAFKKMLDGRVTHALEQMNEHGNDEPMDELHDNVFTLSFMGKTCTMYFGSTEYFAIAEMLDSILEDMQ